MGHRKPRNGHLNAPGNRGAKGTRLSPEAAERVRALIDTTNIIKRLDRFVKGEMEEVTFPEGPRGNQTIVKETRVTTMTRDQVAAAFGLLRKTLPDLPSLDLLQLQQLAPPPTVDITGYNLIMQKLEEMGYDTGRPKPQMIEVDS